MPDRAALVALLAGVRRRLRGQRAIQGGVLAALVCAGVSAVLLAISYALRRPLMLPVCAAATVIAGALVGAVAAALRPIPLARCARAVDQAVGDGADRTLSALVLASGPSAPFVDALLRDATVRARRTSPGAAAPFRRPRGVAPLALGAALVVAFSLLPPRAPRAVASRPTPPSPTVPRLRLDPASLDAEREEIAAAKHAAHDKEDAELRRLAEELASIVKDLGGEGLPHGEVMERLAELERRAEEAAAAAEAMKRAMEAAGKALGSDAASAALGKALEKHDAEAAAKAAAALAEREAHAKAAERQKVADALDKAADGAAREASSASKSPESSAAESKLAAPSTSQGSATEPEEKQRRLARDEKKREEEAAPATAGVRSSERKLDRLERELRESAEACRRDPEACRKKLQETADDLPRMENESTRAGARESLARSVRQMLERLKRSPASAQKAAGQSGQERAFRRAAAGEEPDGVEMAEDGKGGDRPMGMPGKPGSEGEGETAGAEMGAPGVGASEGTRPGDGIGSRPGDEPLGEKTDVPSRGREREAKLKGGSGPTRSEVIEGAARKGFAHTRYQGVFSDYAAVVEESLDATDTPPGRRYLVRRYFQLIRPRAR